MEWNELVEYRLQVGVLLAIVLVIGWYSLSYRPRAAELSRLAQREHTLGEQRAGLEQQLARDRASSAARGRVPGRVASPLANSMSPVERLNYFLDNITQPANALELNYFQVTPLASIAQPGFEELPFSISIAGSFTALADYLYQLEYGQNFIVRDLGIAMRDSKIQADLKLSALLLSDPSAKPAPTTKKDPGPPTSLELARDPFIRPPAKIAVAADGKSYFLNVPPGLQLSGIVWADGRPVAMINNEPYAVGQTIQNKTITKISDHGVELSDRVRTYFLEMEQPPDAGGSVTRQAAAR